MRSRTVTLLAALVVTAAPASAQQAGKIVLEYDDQERLAKKLTDTDGDGKPDEIVYDKKKSKNRTDNVDVTEGNKPTDEELRGLWLRRVQTKPADFLRAKFAFQARNAKESP